VQLLAFILLIGPLIFFHELGHLLAAKLVNVKVLRFSLGFGKPLARIRIGETEYCLAPIPLGGYVKLLGHGADEEIPPQEASRALRNKPLWARFFVLGAGPVVNLALPLLLYFAFFLSHSVVGPPVVGTVLDDSAAAAAEIQAGDRVVEIDGDDVNSWHDMQTRVRVAPERELRLQIERDGVHFDRFVTPRRSVTHDALGESHTIGLLGVYPWIYAPQIGIADPTSPAFEEGLRTGDIITSINGEPIRTVEQLERELAKTRDTSLRLTFLRGKPARAEIGTFLWFESAHAKLLPRAETKFSTGILPANTFIRSVEPSSPAARAGLSPGDRILSVDGRSISRWETLATILDRQGEAPVELRVRSLGEAPRIVKLTQETRSWRDVYRQDHSYLWFGANPYQSRALPPAEPIRGRFTYAARASLDETLSLLRMMWTSLRQLVTLQRSVDELSSVIGIFNIAGTAAERGPGEFLLLMALISMNLGFVNLLPIPILDGGHLMFFTIEAVRRRPLSQRAREITSAVGLIIILTLLLIALRNDVIRFWLSP